MKWMMIVIFLPLGTLYGEEQQTEQKQQYAFEDTWNFRFERSIDVFRLRDQRSQSRSHENIFGDLSGYKNLIDINYGPIGIFAAQTKAEGVFVSAEGYFLSQKIVQDEVGLFVEIKPFREHPSLELKGLSLGLRVSALAGSFAADLNDEFQSHKSEQKYRGAKCGLVLRFYTIADFYFSIGTDVTAFQLKLEDLSIDTINLYQNYTYGVGYAF